MVAPSTRILATGNEFFGFIDLWELFANQRDEQAARMTFLFRQQQGSFWLGPNWGPSQKEVLGPCRRSWGRSAYRACPGARQQRRQAPAGRYSELLRAKGTAPPLSSPVRGWSSSRRKAADNRRRARALDTGYRFGGHPRIIACSLPPAAEKRLSSPAIHQGTITVDNM